MKKALMLWLSLTLITSAQAEQEEIIDHSANLTAGFELPSGTRVMFDLDQCSRFASILGMALSIKMLVSPLALGPVLRQYEVTNNEAREALTPLLNKAAAENLKYMILLLGIAMVPKVIANFIMAKKEFARGETARGLEHFIFTHPFVPWYILATDKKPYDRNFLNRISYALMPFSGLGGLIHVINEPYSFFRDLSENKWPVYFE